MSSATESWDAQWAAFKADTGLDLARTPPWEHDRIYQTFVNWEAWKRGKLICECGESEVDHSVPMGFVLTGYFGENGPGLRFGPGTECLLRSCRCRAFKPAQTPPWLKRTT